MASGTINGTTDNQYISCRLVWKSTKDSSGSNRSDVEVTLQVRKSTASTAGTSGTGYFRLKYGSKTVDYSKSGISIPADGVWRTIKKFELGWITHKSDGTQSLALSLVNSGNYSGLPGTSYKKSYVSGTAKLDKITPPSYTITASAGANGTIAPSGSVSVTKGSSKTFTFTPNSGYKVANVLVNGNSVGAPLSYTFSNVTAAQTISVSFVAVAPNDHTITMQVEGEGQILGNSVVPHGSTHTYTMEPADDHELVAVYVDGVVQDPVPTTYTFSNITAPHTIKAVFEQVGGLPIPEGVTFSETHTAEQEVHIPFVRYHVQYEGEIVQKAILRVFIDEVLHTLVPESVPDRNYDIGAKVLPESVVRVEVETEFAIKNGAYTIEVYESDDDNRWTFLGYADNQLVGLTANQQLWNGAVVNNALTNARYVPSPPPLTMANLATSGTIQIQDAYHKDDFPFRISLRYTRVNRFGPTEPSGTLTFHANKPVLEWSSANYVRISGTVPDKYAILAVELYFAEDESQEFAFLGRASVPPDQNIDDATKAWSFNWTGYQVDTASWLISNLTMPTDNYTNGVPASHMSVLDGRLFFWGNPQHPYRIWYGGKPGNRFSVSPGTDGGFVDVDPGTGSIVKNVLKFKTQQGAAIVTALADNPNSQREARYNLVESRISISNEQSVTGFMAEKIAGAVGCKSTRGAIAAADGLYTMSRYGLAITTLTMEYNAQLQIQYVSDAIEPVFLKLFGTQLTSSVVHEINGVLYMTFGSLDDTLDNVIFCYDIGLKAWWTYTLDIDMPILNMINIDYEGHQEGLGIVTERGVYLLPTTKGSDASELPEHEVLIESGELSTVQPLQTMHHLSQLQMRFDYFIGDLEVSVKCLDQFGREITTKKRISHSTVQHQLTEYIRIDQVVESYQIIVRGKANFRLTHFNAKLYPKPLRIGMVYGFDTSQGHNSENSIRRTFSSYNDLRKAIIP